MVVCGSSMIELSAPSVAYQGLVNPDHNTREGFYNVGKIKEKMGTVGALLVHDKDEAREKEWSYQRAAGDFWGRPRRNACA